MVAHTREFRATWVTTVFRLDFPSTTLTPAQAQNEVAAIVDEAVSAGLNALYFQVRSESDAFYASKLEPWIRFASGTQGTSPGYDPLALMITTAHAKGIEVHAWLNPYRGMASLGVTTASNHLRKLYPDAAITYGGTIIPTLALYKVGTSAESTTSEYEQIALARGEAGASGQTHFRHEFLASDAASSETALANAYAAPRGRPVVPGVAGGTVAIPTATMATGALTLAHPAPATIRGYAIYRSNTGA